MGVLQTSPCGMPCGVLAVEIIRVKHRTISPIAELFIDEMHKIVRPLRQGAL